MDTIILAAGIGERLNLGYPKQFYKINGKPFFISAVEILRRHPQVDRIIMTYNKNFLDSYTKYISEYRINDIVFVEGGKTRQESVYNALKEVKSEKVLIHEAARPLISLDFIDYILSFENETAVVPAIPVKFTVSVGDDYMTSELDRSKLKNIQLPQLFVTSELLKAHEMAIKDNYLSTEDGSLVFHYGGKVRFVEGRESNIKITTMLDIEMVNKLIKF